MRIAIVSDLHGNLPDIEKSDLLIIAGDTFIGGTFEEQQSWAWSSFKPWLESLPVDQIIGIAGNHDIYCTIDTNDELPWMYLEDQLIIYNNIRIYGTPWVKKIPTDFPFMITEDKLFQKFKHIPYDLDILISHGPPFGCLDVHDSLRCGSVSLLNAIRLKKPNIVVCGHIHDNRGCVKLFHSMVYNVAMVDNKNNMIGNVVYLDYMSPTLPG